MKQMFSSVFFNRKFYLNSDISKAVTRWSLSAIGVNLGRSRVLSGPLNNH